MDSLRCRMKGRKGFCMNKDRKAIFILFLLVVLILSGCDETTQTTDLSEYGNLTGLEWHQTQRAKDDFEALFPQRIEPYFEEVEYYYRAKDLFPWYEILLEFTIRSQEDFEAYLSTLPAMDEFHPSPYLPSYLEYTRGTNYVDFDPINAEDRANGAGTEYFRIDCARIQKIMVNMETHHVVIACLWISDDGGTKTTEVYYFQHFQIDPQLFAQIENPKNRNTGN